MTRFALTLTFVGLAVAVGCGGPSLAEVSGTVKVDGKELPEGDIIFEADDGTITPAAGKIADGNYSLIVAPGKKKVRINASRPTKTPDPLMGAAARESMIAKEHNVETTLSADVKPGRQDRVNFEVKSIR